MIKCNICDPGITGITLDKFSMPHPQGYEPLFIDFLT